VKNEIEIKVRFAETDAMGVVYHGNFYCWLEMGRYDLLEKYCENSKREMAFGNYYLPVTKAECNYLDFVKFGDTIVVTTYLVRTDVPKLIFVSEIRKKGSKKLAARACTEHVFLNSEYKMLFKLPSFFKEDLEQIEREHPECLLTEKQRKERMKK
jgi:acyl-CoA thioester hydrolase